MVGSEPGPTLVPITVFCLLRLEMFLVSLPSVPLVPARLPHSQIAVLVCQVGDSWESLLFGVRGRSAFGVCTEVGEARPTPALERRSKDGPQLLISGVSSAHLSHAVLMAWLSLPLPLQYIHLVGRGDVGPVLTLICLPWVWRNLF